MVSEPNEKDQIFNLIKEFLKIMGCGDSLVSFEEAGDYLIFNIYTDQAKLLIGSGGDSLDALQYIVKLIARKTLINLPDFIIDVNGYRKDKIERLKLYLKTVIRDAINNKQPIQLEPMPAYERKIIHLESAVNPNIQTESVGEEPERAVIIKPIL